MTDFPGVCPVCEGDYNHVIHNGHRNSWPHDVAKVAVCTDETERMFVHVTEVL